MHFSELLIYGVQFTLIMEKTSKTILSLIISFLVTYSLIVPTVPYFRSRRFTSAVNGSVDPSDPSQSATTTEQTSADSAQHVETTSKSEPQKADDANSEQETTKQSEQTTKASSGPTIQRTHKQIEQSNDLKFLPVLTTHLREELGR